MLSGGSVACLHVWLAIGFRSLDADDSDDCPLPENTDETKEWAALLPIPAIMSYSISIREG